MMYHQKFRVAPGKLTGWKRLVGQEVPQDAYSDLIAVSGTSNYGSQIVGLTDINGDAVYGSPANASMNCRRLTQIVNGAQTAKATQPALDLWIPLIFW